MAGWLGDGATPIEQEAEPAVALLDVQPQDHILEIGFGPGLVIRELARRATDGFVLGIDRSEVMVRQAAVRNRRCRPRSSRVATRSAWTCDFSARCSTRATTISDVARTRGRSRSSRGAAAGRSSGDCLAAALSQLPPRQLNASRRRRGGFAMLASSAPEGDAEPAASGVCVPAEALVRGELSW